MAGAFLMHWNLRLVIGDRDHRPHVREVYYDDAARPFGYSQASVWDILRHMGEWKQMGVLRSPNDFNGRLERDR